MGEVKFIRDKLSHKDSGLYEVFKIKKGVCYYRKVKAQ